MNDNKEKEHTGQCLGDVCEECLNFHKQWSYVASEHGVICEIYSFVLEQSGAEFVNGHDEVAHILRGLAAKLKPRADETKAKLNSFIERSNKYNIS